MTATPKLCTVVVSASGARCGQPAVTVRETLFGEVAECAEHAVPVAAPAAPATLEGRRVEISWHSWPKPGVVVGERGRKVEVRFVPRAGAEPIVRAFAREDVRGL